MPLSVVIPTYGRDQILTETIAQLLAQRPVVGEVLAIDQTPRHLPEIERQLSVWDAQGDIRWIRMASPSQPAACNVGLRLASQPYVLFLDDDIRVDMGFASAHLDAFLSDDVWAVVGRVLQPEDAEDAGCSGCTPKILPTSESCGRRERRSLWMRDLGFRFNAAAPAWITNGMSGNLCVRRNRALQIGGFDENFLPPVSFRFDTDFCKRLCAAGGRIRFEPRACIHHLRAPAGGTRSLGSHLTSASPLHGVGDYYYALRQGVGAEAFWYMMRRLFREVRTRFHLRRPWWIPVKLIGEVRALELAVRLNRRGPKLLAAGQG